MNLRLITLVVFLLLPVQSIVLADATPEQLFSWSDGALRLKVEREKGAESYDVKLQYVDNSQSDNRSKGGAFSVTQTPGKIDLTLNNHPTRSKSSMRLGDSSFIESVTVDGNENATIITLRIPPDSSYHSNWDSVSSTLNLSRKIKTVIKHSETISSYPPQPDTSKREPNLQSTVKALSAPSIVKAGLLNSGAIHRASQKRTVDKEVLKSNNGFEEIPAVDLDEDTHLLTSIDFGSDLSPDSIAFGVTAWPEFKLRQLSDNEFVVQIEGTTVKDKRLLLPRYAPSSNRSFKYVVITRDKGSIAINIATEPHVHLEPRVFDQRLVILATAKS